MSGKVISVILRLDQPVDHLSWYAQSQKVAEDLTETERSFGTGWDSWMLKRLEPTTLIPPLRPEPLWLQPSSLGTS